MKTKVTDVMWSIAPECRLWCLWPTCVLIYGMCPHHQVDLRENELSLVQSIAVIYLTPQEEVQM